MSAEKGSLFIWKWFGQAAFSGLLLRGAGAAFNLLAIPIAVRSLGVEKFAATGALLGFATWLTIGGGGLGNAIAMLVAADPKGPQQQRDLIWQGAMSCFGGSLLIWFICVLLVPAFTSHILPHAEPNIVRDFQIASYCCFGAFALSAAAAPFEGMYVGSLRATYCTNVRLVWQLIAIVAMLTVGALATEITAMALLLVMGPTAASIWFLVKGIIDCSPPSGFRFSFSRGLPILVQGFGFLASSMAVLFYGGGSLPLFTVAFGYDQVSTATVMARIIQIYFGILYIVLLPVGMILRQAKTEANASQARQSLAFAGIAIVCTSVGLAFASLFFGRRVIDLWIGAPLIALDSWLPPLAAMFVVSGWSISWTYLAQAMRGSILGAKLAILEISAATLAYFVLGKHLSPASSLYVLAAAMLACSGTVLPIIVGRDLALLARGAPPKH